MTQRETARSAALFERAVRCIPGGVNSPARAFGAVGGNPPFIASAKGAEIADADGVKYLDFVGSWGPMILGHRHPEVIAAIAEQLEKGTSYGAPTEIEVEIAELICASIPAVESIRFVNSGTEATMSAVRLARAATGRDRIIKFEGCYHGHGDSFLCKAGSGAATFGVPDSPGVPAALAALTLNARFNDLESVQQLLQAYPGQVAAVIAEPVVGNMGCVPPDPEFLKGLRVLCDEAGALLILDEVMTGFRLGFGGAQALYGVRPDLAAFGKIIGGGLPVGAYGGARGLMQRLAPAGPVYQAGTLSGNPLAMAAGLATLKILSRRPEIYDYLETIGARLEDGVREIAAARPGALSLNRVGSMATLFFHPGPVRNWDDASRSDRARFAAYHRAMLDRGVYMPCSQFEAFFLNAAMTDCQIDWTVGAMEEAVDIALQA